MNERKLPQTSVIGAMHLRIPVSDWIAMISPKRTRSRRYSLVAILCAIFLFCVFASDASATWSKLAQFSARVTCGYFWNKDVGMVCVAGTTTTAAIELTTDGGVSWRAASIPMWTTSGGILFTDLWFADRLNGYCTFLFESTGASMWQTNDGGLTWSNMNFQGSPCSVRKTSKALIVTQYTGPGVTISTDNGASWATKVLPGLDGLAFTDDLHGCVGGFGTPLYYTADGGLTWASGTPSVVEESWGVYAEPFTQHMFSVPENNFFTTTSPVYRSLDNGQSWQQIQSVLFKPSGDIQGSGSTLYVQNSGISGGAAGVFRSTDGGFSWINIGGPNTGQFDVRLIVTDCGSTLIAFDNSGGVYRTIDGGDGTIINTCSFAPDTLKSMAANLCDSLKQLFFFHNRSTDSVAVLDVRVLDSTRSPYNSKAIHFDSIPSLYHLLASQDSMGFSMGWVPIRFLHRAATDSSKIRIVVYHLKGGGRDTLYFPLKLIALATAPQFVLSATQLQIAPVSLCSVFDTIIQLFNAGCDTLTVLNSTLQQHLDWQLLDPQGKPLVLPIRILTGSRASFKLRFTARHKLLAHDSLVLKLRQLGQDTNVGVGITGSAIFSNPILAANAINFDSTSTCSSLDSIWKCINIGCDTIFITKIDLNSPDYSIFDNTGAPIVLPISLNSKDSLTDRIHFAPSQLGPRVASATLHYSYLGFDTSITLSLLGVGRSVGKFEHYARLDFGKVSVCKPADSAIRFLNSTCVDLSIDSLWITPLFVADPITLPTVLKKDSALRLPIHYTVHQKGRASGSMFVRVKVNGVAQIDTIPLSGFGTSGSSSLIIKPALDSINFGTRSACSGPDSIVFTCVNPGCDSLVLGTSIIEGNCSAMTLAQSGNAPTILMNGDSTHIVLSLAPKEGKYSGDLKIHFTLADGSVHDSLIPINALVTHGTRILQLDTNTVDLGTIAACATRDTTIIYTNSGCAPITIRARSITGGAMVLAKTLTDPITLASGESDTIHVFYDGSHSGRCTSTLTIHSNADRDSIGSVTLAINIPPVDSVRFDIVVTPASTNAGDIVTANVLPDRTITGKSLTTMRGVLTFPNDGFDLVDRSNEPGVNVNWSPTIISGNMLQLPFSITASGDIPIDPAQSLISLKLRVMLSDSTATHVWMDSLALNGKQPNYGNCVLASSTKAGRFTLSLTSCGDKTIQKELSHQPLLEITPVHPDPVTGARVKIGIRSEITGVNRLTLRDQLGRIIQTREVSTDANEPKEIQLDLKQLPTGSYYYSVEFRATDTTQRESHNGSFYLIK